MSKKYVIDIPDDAQYILINGASENHCYTRVEQVEGLEELNSDYINEHYGELQDDAYKRGLSDVSASGYRGQYEDVYRRGYKNGRNIGIKDGMCDAWEAARRIVVDTDHGGLALGTLSEIFGTQSYSYIMRENTAQEAIDKIKAYEDKHSDRIEVGDEVKFLPNDRRGIVTACHVPDVYAENDKYAVFCGTSVEYVLKQHITKTGKHYDIASILEAMRQ